MLESRNVRKSYCAELSTLTEGALERPIYYFEPEHCPYSPTSSVRSMLDDDDWSVRRQLLSRWTTPVVWISDLTALTVDEWQMAAGGISWQVFGVNLLGGQPSLDAAAQALFPSAPAARSSSVRRTSRSSSSTPLIA
jgi:hypothetical protein